MVARSRRCPGSWTVAGSNRWTSPAPAVPGNCSVELESADAIDASVVVGALRRGDAIVTSDRRDIEILANAVGRRIGVIAV